MRKSRIRCVLVLILGGGLANVSCAEESGKVEKTLRAQDPIDYRPLAFYPRRWKEKGANGQLVPWEGRAMVLLTATSDLDPARVARFVARLDEAWKLYETITGGKPKAGRKVLEKGYVAAIPAVPRGLSCDEGACGFLGSTGVEVSTFDADWSTFLRDERRFPAAYLSALARNFFGLSQRHSLFADGYALLLSTIALETMKLQIDKELLAALKKRESDYAESNLSWFEAFAGRRRTRLRDREGRPIPHSEERVLYASILWKLRSDHGADFVGRFYRALQGVPRFSPSTREGQAEQALNFVLAANAAARKDLSPVFVQRWRFPVSKPAQSVLAKTRWDGGLPTDLAAVRRAIDIAEEIAD